MDDMQLSSPGILGIDAGSTRIKGALWDGFQWTFLSVPLKDNYGDSLYYLIREFTRYGGGKSVMTIATGYGRNNVETADKRVNEIGCHARGAGYLVPGCRTVIDIGGQDAKVISIGEDGKYSDFSMNDKCAAGTGRYLSVLAEHLGVPLESLGATGSGVQPLQLSSMCTVFAESEVIGLLAQNVPKAEIIAGIHDSIAKRTRSLAHRIAILDPVAFTGGVALNSDIAKRLSDILGHHVIVPHYAEFSAAIGAVLFGGVVIPGLGDCRVTKIEGNQV